MLAEAQDNADGDPRSLCNANMSTPGDGSSPRMQMFLCDEDSPERDGDFDVVVIGHEYAHGIHSRLLGTSGNQRANEGWADYFGLSLVAEPDDPYGGAYGVGSYLFDDDGSGIRSFPYSTDPAIYQRTYADINDSASCAVKTCTSDDTETCSEDEDCSTGGDTCDALTCSFHEDCEMPNTTISQGPCRTGVHRTGELWANSLWIMRMNLIGKYGYAAGSSKSNLLVMDGMKVSPDDPTFLDGRDALLAADLANYGGANECIIWDAFARMGMGATALTSGVDDINPLEAFDLPSQCSPVMALTTDPDIGAVCDGDTGSTELVVTNTGSGELIITGVEKTSGSDDISVDALPETPVFLSGGAHIGFTVRCEPSSAGNKTATITVTSNDAANSPTDIEYTCEAGSGEIVTTYDGSYGNVCLGDSSTQDLMIQNSGACDLTVSNISSTNGEFALATVMTFPLVIASGGEVTVPVEFEPVGDTDAVAASISISHDGTNTGSPKQLSTSGRSDDAVLDTFIADTGSFDDVCAGDIWDLPLTIENSGPCPMEINTVAVLPGANTQADDFELPAGSFNETIVAPGTSIQVPVRFSPSAFDNEPPLVRLSKIRVTAETQHASSDLVPSDTDISGTVPPPDINVAIADNGDFGDVCKTDHADLDLTLFNQGKCDLTISDISLIPDAGSFELPSDLQFPLVLSHDADFTVPVRYSPDQCSDVPELRTVQITSDDPDENTVDVDVSGLSPCPNLVIDPEDLTGLFAFPATVVDTTGSLGCFSDRSVDLRNTGECPLTITSITTTGPDFAVLTPSQLPIILPTGEETLSVDVRFTPQSDADPLAPGELTDSLVIVSDDPDFPHDADLCGEGVAQSGVRILVTDISSGTPVPVDEVDEITIASKGKHRPSPVSLRFTDQPLSATSVCGNAVQYHVDQETLPETHTTGSNPKSSYQAKAKEGNLQSSDSFTLHQCEFREFQLQLQSSTSEVCLLKQKGESCTTAGECCSGRCGGKNGSKTCK